MSSALGTQIDGQHYTDMKMQPLELVYILGGSPVFCKAAKYLTRKKNDRKINLDKALHCISLEQELVTMGYHNYNHYFNYDYKEIIGQFTDNLFIRDALKFIYEKNLSSAKEVVAKLMISEGL